MGRGILEPESPGKDELGDEGRWWGGVNMDPWKGEISSCPGGRAEERGPHPPAP